MYSYLCMSLATAVNLQSTSQWLREDFLTYIRDWENQAAKLPCDKRDQRKTCLSIETLEGMRITGL